MWGSVPFSSLFESPLCVVFSLFLSPSVFMSTSSSSSSSSVVVSVSHSAFSHFCRRLILIPLITSLSVSSFPLWDSVSASNTYFDPNPWSAWSTPLHFTPTHLQPAPLSWDTVMAPVVWTLPHHPSSSFSFHGQRHDTDSIHAIHKRIDRDVHHIQREMHGIWSHASRDTTSYF